MYCTTCGKQNPEGNKFCSYCGAIMQGEPPAPDSAAAPPPSTFDRGPSPTFCTVCGKQIAEGSSFCTSCGSSISGPPGRPAYAGMGGGRVEERNIVLYIILTLITCGLFNIYWFIVLAGDIRTLRQADDPNGVVDWIIGFITCGIYFYVCYYRYSKFIVEIQQRKRMPVNDLSVIALILAIFALSIVSIALIQNEINKLARV